MTHNTTIAAMTSVLPVITQTQLLDYWQGHRRVTRRLIEAFPEKEFFTYSIGGMRTAAELIQEIADMGVPGIRGILTGEWQSMDHMAGVAVPSTKAEILARWDEATRQLDELFPQIDPQVFQESTLFFGQWQGPVYWAILYSIDNEIHHRSQAYVYLRALGIEPPFFYDRS